WHGVVLPCGWLGVLALDHLRVLAHLLIARLHVVLVDDLHALVADPVRGRARRAGHRVNVRGHAAAVAVRGAILLVPDGGPVFGRAQRLVIGLVGVRRRVVRPDPARRRVEDPRPRVAVV